MGISQRIQEERKRLGLTQEAAAERMGSTKRSLINWEGGAALPGAEALSRFAEIGADVLYILTGRLDQASLSSDEALVIQMYRSATPPVKAAALGALVGASTSGGQTMSNVGSGNVQAGNVEGGLNVGRSTTRRRVTK
ncbi:MAG: helix-turn-helix transcriptional regulator [Comamonas sp.]|uniref:helix-turn-helix domain-containing protein n=1 Tax=Comamonas sp. TaxID=34028 RepID=UPI002FC5CA00